MENSKGIPLKSELGVTRLISDFYFEFPEDFDYSGESHSGWEFVYVDKGKVSVGADNATYILKKGEMVCHKPYEFHTLKPYDGKAAVIIICFESSDEYMAYFNNKILSVTQRQKQYLYDIADMGKTVFLPKHPLQIVEDGQMDLSGDATALQLQFVKNAIQLLLLALVNADTTEKQSRITIYEHDSQRKTLTKNIKDYLKQNLDKPISLEEISGRFSYSLSSIKRIFKEETGSSIIAYCNLLRMRKAKELLLNTNATIGQIAGEVGYSSVYYFSLAFKKKWGISPSKYRASAGKEEE